MTIALCVGCIIAADAQSTFTERLQKSNTGEGKISVTQDKSIDELVNGSAAIKQPQKDKPEQKPTVAAKPEQKPTVAARSEQKPTVATPKEKEMPAATAKAAPKENEAQTVITPDSVDLHKKVMKGVKVNGYRVQVFAGGNSRNDRMKAERTGENIKSLFPGEPIYVHFYSPRWICRMGNYRTYEEAHEVLKKVKQLGYQSAIIVKGKITVQY